MNIIYDMFAFLFGAAIGSFLNVVIYRMPEGMSLIKPNSFCPNCKKPIEWFENIPVISYIFLRGKCSGCHSQISIRYPLVEIITGCLFLYSFIHFRLSIDFFFFIFFFCSLIIVSSIDFSHQIIPDIISMPGIFIGLIFQIIKSNFMPGLIGILFGGGLIFLIRIIGGKVYKKEVMGMGDVYLTAMIGAFVGFPLILPAIFIAALIGSILGIIFIISTKQSRESPIPFGPFLSIGGILTIILHQKIIDVFAFLGVYF
jgi:leader peptidase (prepilin peptidase)/N-methyltransferase